MPLQDTSRPSPGNGTSEKRLYRKEKRMIGAWIGALLIGLTLGLLGSGGSILTVPVLVYLVGEPGKLAIAESLGIVMLISGFGAVPYALKKQVDGRSVFFFGLPAMGGAYAGAYLSKFVAGTVQLSIFAGVMLLAAALMFKNPLRRGEAARTRPAPWNVALQGVAVGCLTGFVGVGGGFLIVPALVLLGGLPMHLAVGTSLVIIALNAASGFFKHLDVLAGTGYAADWPLIFAFGAIGVVGSFIGGRMGAHVPQDRLKKGFAAFLVVMGLFVLWQNGIAPGG